MTTTFENWKLEACAHAAHETNRAYCRSIGDDSQLPWDTAEEWQKRAARDGVLRLVENPQLTPEQAHDAWSTLKRTDGWVYGTIKDPVAKTHPCLVAYKDLPPEQQIKDQLFTTVVKARIDTFWRRPQ